ncbi:hypothetical protein HZZ13_34815 [Bradyrhizobium sp. CNPSo 4010]|uniref:Uncharacterized protein n=1 Tax=Bradyrhizobium agreste TaxID=2751811 RepID=A0ABS0Q1E6_9BRAD|nr:hypothetical protein [Bradyrhizobium agreste]MBH5402932.1 hypothetical protein [Bradyrhizobium agreste]
MRSVGFLVVAMLLAATSAQAGGPYPAVPTETGIAPSVGPIRNAYRCAQGPVINFYHRGRRDRRRPFQATRREIIRR